MSVVERRRTVYAGKLLTTFEIRSAEVGGRYGLVRQVVPPGFLMLPHTHENEDQAAMVVSGTLGVLVGEREFECGPGEVLLRPRGLVHSIWNASESPVEILEITSPGRFEEYFEALGELTATGRLTDAPDLAAEWKVVPSMELVEYLTQKYGVAL